MTTRGERPADLPRDAQEPEAPAGPRRPGLRRRTREGDGLSWQFWALVGSFSGALACVLLHGFAAALLLGCAPLHVRLARLSSGWHDGPGEV